MKFPQTIYKSNTISKKSVQSQKGSDAFKHIFRKIIQLKHVKDFLSAKCNWNAQLVTHFNKFPCMTCSLNAAFSAVLFLLKLLYKNIYFF